MANQKHEGSAANKSVRPEGGRARILVVDDHPIFCQGMSDLLNRQKDTRCCGEAGTIPEAQKKIAAEKPDLVLLDLRLGQSDGLEAIKGLKALFPDLRILVISQFDEMVYAERALRAGAAGYVMKEQATEHILHAVRTVLAGELYVSAKIGMMAVSRVLKEKAPAPDSSLAALSDRELHVFIGVGQGKSNKQIATEMNLSVKTVETYREHIKYKLGFATGAQLVLEARRAAESDRASGPPPSPSA